MRPKNPTTALRARTLVTQALCVLGLAGMSLGVLDPSEGSGGILAGTCLATLGAIVGRSRFRRLMYWSLVLVVIGVAGMWVTSAMGGFGGDTGRSDWWALILVPYAAGTIIGIVGAARASLEALMR